MAQEQKRLRRKRQEEHNLCFYNAEEVINWCAAKCASGNLDKFHTDVIRDYYNSIENQEDLEEALDWLTEHLFEDAKVTLKITLTSGQTLSAKNYDIKGNGCR